uniref:Cytokine receptor family B13 n=1 Tax=Siniperca chuatsi TaxID=119488 RepID=A0A516AFH5_SINCH|nr:cytokine receptor family B13 [Siniperca chuatsi]
MFLAKCPVFFFLIWSQAAAAHVESPTNVTLHCRNLHNVLEWSYDQLSPGLKFRVNIGSYINISHNVVWVDSPTRQADVSFLSDPNNEYFLTVTAVIGPNESEHAPPDGIVFSYFKDSPANQICFVDLPPVNVTAQQDDTILFRFTHPWLLYHQKLPGNRNPKMKRHGAQFSSTQLPVFTYNVVIINQKERHYSFNCEESVCEERLDVDAAREKHCLKIRGELEKMAVQATQEYCTLPLDITSHGSNNYIYIIVAIVLALGAAAFGVFFMVYQKWTRPSTSLPQSVSITSRLKQWTFGVVQESIVVPQVGPSSPTPLLSTTEEKEFPPNVPFTTEPDPFLHNGGLSTKDEGVCDLMEAENDDAPGYMKGGNLDEDETPNFSEPPSGYERRPVVVEIAPGEQVEGYRGGGTGVL